MIRTLLAAIVVFALSFVSLFGYRTAQACTPGQAATGDEVLDLKNAKCPVMGGDAKADVYTDYEGLRIHFCCPGCDKTFLKSPKKYLAKLGITDIDEYKRTHSKR